MGPSEALVETLAANGVTHVFGIVGSSFMDALDSFPAAGIQFVPVAHEQGAIHMADGYARASGRHGVCIAQNGPGVTNFVTGVAAAYWAHSPVVFITPETGSMTMGLGGFQETEQLPIFSKITKYQGHVNNPRRMAEIAARCFDRAMLEAGPAQLNIPRDFFYGDIEASIARPMRLRNGPGDAAALDAAAELLCGASFPVIVAGGGVITAGATAEAIELADLLGAAVCNSYLHNDSFPASHPLAAGPLGYQGSKAAMKLIAQADVVLALGTRLGPFGTLPQHGLDYWPQQAQIIQIDSDPRMLGLVKPISVGIQGDARAAASALMARLKERRPAGAASRAARLARIAAEKRTWEAELRDWTHERDAYSLEVAASSRRMHPRELLTCARESIGVTVVVFNNEQWGAEKKNHVDFYSRRYQGVNLQNPSWAAVARAFGCDGVTVERLADIGPALRAAAAAQSEGKTTVLEVMVTQELGDPFRRDALSKPVRHLAKYQKFM